MFWCFLPLLALGFSDRSWGFSHEDDDDDEDGDGDDDDDDGDGNAKHELEEEEQLGDLFIFFSSPPTKYIKKG